MNALEYLEYFTHKQTERDRAEFINLICGYIDFYQQFIEPWKDYKLMRVSDNLRGIDLPMPCSFEATWTTEGALPEFDFLQIDIEHIELNKVAWQWWNEEYPIRMYTCRIGYGHKTKRIAYCDFRQHFIGISGHWEEC